MKGLLILYNNFEDCEALVTRAVLIKNNFNIISATNNKNLEVMSATRLIVKADIYLESLQYHHYDFLIIPGGPYVHQVISQNNTELKQILTIINHFHQKNKLIATICAAPAFLGKLNLLKNKKFTCYPGYESFIEGNYMINATSVISENFITSRSPDTVFDFAFQIIQKLNIEI